LRFRLVGPAQAVWLWVSFACASGLWGLPKPEAQAKDILVGPAEA
jgi:hypothetical protein